MDCFWISLDGWKTKVQKMLCYMYIMSRDGVLFCGWATVSLVALETCGYRTSSVSFGDGKGTVKSSNGEIHYESKVVSQRLATLVVVTLGLNLVADWANEVGFLARLIVRI